jgi:hypothetical protein
MNVYTYSNKAKTEIGHPTRNGGFAARLKFAGRKEAKLALEIATQIACEDMTRTEYQAAVRRAVSHLEPLRGGFARQEPGRVSE